MRTIDVLAIQRTTAAERARITAVDPAIRLTDAGGWFDGELRDTWPAATVARYLATDATGHGTRADRDRLLARAEVILGGWPFPLDLRARATRLAWFHQRPAGAANLRRGDLWGSDVIVTTSRGAGNTLAMAEYAVAGMLHFAKSLHRASLDRDAGAFDHAAYRPLLLHGKTACVVGAGGIGREVGRLCAALGMRVLGTRRQPEPDAPLPAGFAALGGPAELDRFLSDSDFVAICCQSTPQTTRLFDQARFAAMKPGSVLVNLARGEIVDEPALIDALRRGHLRGVVLDVYADEFETTPSPALWRDPRVLITPHVSAQSDDSRHRAIELFCDNLRAYGTSEQVPSSRIIPSRGNGLASPAGTYSDLPYVAGVPLRNVVDWQRGY